MLIATQNRMNGTKHYSLAATESWSKVMESWSPRGPLRIKENVL